MDIIWLILAALVILVGLIGAIIPGIPGPAASYAGLLIALLSDDASLDNDLLLVLGIIAVLVTATDYWVPVYGTKKFGGSKAGVNGSIIGLVLALILLPMLGIVIGPFGLTGIILGPFAGAYIGEVMNNTTSDKAFRAAIGSFIGFLAGTFLKLIYSGLIVYYFVLSLL